MENFESKAKMAPKDFFLNLGWVAALYGSVVSLINLLFEVINRVFPDPVNQYWSGYYSSGVRWAIAWLVVIFPLYILISWYLKEIFTADPTRKNLSIRKWLVFLTLFLSSVTIVVDLIVLINAFLGGELSSRFLLKVFSVFAVAVLVFGYYFYDLRTEGATGRTGKVFAIVSVLIVTASLIWAFSVIGSPMTERLRRFDEQKIQDLQNIQWQIINFWQTKGSLPKTLKEIEDPLSNFSLPKDSESGKEYEYEATGKLSFRLCAEFNLPDEDGQTTRRDFGSQWLHSEGRVCYERTVDIDRYPVLEKELRAVPVSLPAH